MKKTIISMSLVCVIMSGLVGLLSYKAGCNNTYEKATVEMETDASAYKIQLAQYESELDELRNELDNIYAELTKMYNDEAFELQWYYDDGLYSYEDNGKLFGVTRMRCY